MVPLKEPSRIFQAVWAYCLISRDGSNAKAQRHEANQKAQGDSGSSAGGALNSGAIHLELDAQRADNGSRGSGLNAERIVDRVVELAIEKIFTFSCAR